MNGCQHGLAKGLLLKKSKNLYLATGFDLE